MKPTSQSQKGFTLIELMVVVVIIAIISGILIPRLLSVFDRGKKAELEQQMPEKSGEQQPAPASLPQGVPPVIESAEMDMSLRSTYHRLGMEVYTRYEVHCTGRLVFRRASDDPNPVLLAIPLPEGRAEASDVRLLLTRSSDSTTWEPDNLVYQGQQLYWSGDVADDEQIIAEINFVALGRDQFIYPLPRSRHLRALDVAMTLTGGAAQIIPDHALQPTERSDQSLAWRFQNLVTDRAIMIEIPGALSPLGRVLLLVRLVAVAVLFFGFGFWYLSAPGQLKDFRWGHFLLLALTYSLYFVIFTVISLQEAMNPWLAMIISAVFSLPLLLLHVTRAIHFDFALHRALPLAIFTLGLVINGVYGGVVRDYVFIAAAIFVIAYLTLTYDSWAEGREQYREQQREQLKARLTGIRTKLNVEVRQIFDDLSVADKEAERLIALSEKPDLATERDLLIEKRKPVAELKKEYRDLEKRLPDLRTAADLFDRKWYDDFEQEIEQFGDNAKRITQELQQGIDRLKDRKNAIRSQQTEDIYCIACGAAAPPSPYCRECGTPRARELTCRECGCQVLLPLHVIAEDVQSITCYCTYCGEPYDPVVLRPPQSAPPPVEPQDKENG